MSRVMLKTDTQGYDVRVIRGAGEKLLLVSCFLFEVSMRPAYVDSDSGLEAVLTTSKSTVFDWRACHPCRAPGLALLL